MNDLFTLLLALVIAAYGLLLIVGGPPRANRLPHWIWRRFKLVARPALRRTLSALRFVVISGMRFVLCRPRR